MLSTAVLLTCVMSGLPQASAVPPMDADSTSARVPPSSSTLGSPLSIVQQRKQMEPARLREIKQYILEKLDRRQPTPSRSTSSPDNDDDASPHLQPVSNLDSLPPSWTAMIRGESLRMASRSSSSGGNDSSPATSSGHQRQSKNRRLNHRQQQGSQDERRRSSDGTDSRRSSVQRAQPRQQQQPHGQAKNKNGNLPSRRNESKAGHGAQMMTEIISTAETGIGH